MTCTQLSEKFLVIRVSPCVASLAVVSTLYTHSPAGFYPHELIACSPLPVPIALDLLSCK